jgi:predicted anti-sigma-YlaC factor YlaD
MFSCKEIAQQASEHIDQQLNWQQRLAFRSHLFICRNCRRYINQLRSSIGSLKLLRTRQAPVLTDQQKQLAEQLRQQANKR